LTFERIFPDFSATPVCVRAGNRGDKHGDPVRHRAGQDEVQHPHTGHAPTDTQNVSSSVPDPPGSLIIWSQGCGSERLISDPDPLNKEISFENVLKSEQLHLDYTNTT